MIITDPENISLKISAIGRAHLNKFFGKDVPDQKLAALVGALDESIITLTPLGKGFVSFAKHEYIIEQTRIGCSDSKQGLFITNDFFQLSGDAPNRTGLISFARQVKAARELGFSFIRTRAEGSPNDPDGFNGYYVWARYGYDALLEQEFLSKLPKRFGKCISLNDLMLHGGKNWWRRHGSACDMIFSLSEDEPSLTVLRNYLVEKEMEIDL